MTTLNPQTPQRQLLETLPPSDLKSSEQRESASSMNTQNVGQNSGVSLYTPHPAVIFQTTTIAPSPPPNPSTSSNEPTATSTIDSSSYSHPLNSHVACSSSLRLQTDVISGSSSMPATDDNVSARRSGEFHPRPAKSVGPSSISRTNSIKNSLANHFVSAGGLNSTPNSALSSPMLSAMSDVTPLPSPLMTGDSPGPWKLLGSRPTSRDTSVPFGLSDAALVTANGESISSAIANLSKRRAYHGLMMNASESALNDPQINREKNIEAHNNNSSNNRSVSEYIPENIQIPKVRPQAVSGSHAMLSDSTSDCLSPTESNMRREPNLAVKRGIAQVARPPTPPSSRTGGESSDSDSSFTHSKPSRLSKYFEAYTLNDHKRRRWRGLNQLGEGTFSKVLLATSQMSDESDRIDENDVFSSKAEGIRRTPSYDLKKLVAIKICEHGPKGGASEERVEMSLKRELEIMKSIHHPSLVNLKAFSIEETRAILVLSYCPGGDLFEVASEHRDLLVPVLLRRMFAELVAAVRYLHERHIVHRDIKLENVLVNLPQHELAQQIDWVTYPYAVVTLTDLGLSRRVADDEKLTTRCGSDDYAAPEVIIGQSYDGRAVDAWSLGVLLYALLESRLPFDPTPGMSEGHKQRSKTSHRIARVEWRWIEYAGDDGDHEGDMARFEARGLLGAMEVTENLLKRARSRWSLEKVAQQPWVMDSIRVEGGIAFRQEDNPDEITTAFGHH